MIICLWEIFRPFDYFLALDPAKPWFDVSAASNTIRKDDAQLVDVMHTNSGFLLNVRKYFIKN